MYNMKKIINYLLIAATVCGISFAAASCSKDDDNDKRTPAVRTAWWTSRK